MIRCTVGFAFVALFQKLGESGTERVIGQGQGVLGPCGQVERRHLMDQLRVHHTIKAGADEWRCGP